MNPRGFDRNLMKQAQKLQEQLLRAQQQLQESTVEGTAGGGAVRVVLKGDQHVESVTIDPEVVDPEDVEMLQDLVVAAVNEAVDKLQALQSQLLGGLTGGMKLPGMP